MKQRAAMFVAGGDQVQIRIKNFMINKRIVHQFFIIEGEDKIAFSLFQVKYGVVDVNRFNMKSLIFTVGVTGDDLGQ